MGLNLPDLQTVKELLKARYLAAVWGTGALFLFLPDSFASKLHIDALRTTIGSWVGMGTLGFFSLWTVTMVAHYLEWRKEGASELERQDRSLQYLWTLNDEEWAILAYCLLNREQTVLVELTNPAANALTSKGLLLRAGTGGNILAFPHTVPPFVWIQLQLFERRFLESRSDRADELIQNFMRELPQPHFPYTRRSFRAG